MSTGLAGSPGLGAQPAAADHCAVSRTSKQKPLRGSRGAFLILSSPFLQQTHTELWTFNVPNSSHGTAHRRCRENRTVLFDSINHTIM